MNAGEARVIIKEAVLAAQKKARSQGYDTFGKTYYCDKNLEESVEFNEKVILVFGSVSIGLSELERDEYCTYALCCEIKTGLVDEAELQKEISEFNEDVEKLLLEISSAPSPKDKILEINEKQDTEARKSFEEFNGEVRKMKLKLYTLLGALAVIVLAVIILGFVL